ncbi:MAG: bis(5'-nucleosyl)-tetraphosphatase (symmetrical) YqeK [Bacillota bacterium]
MQRETARELLQAKGSTRFYRHGRGVERTAFLLAKKYGIDAEKAAFAGLMHDYGKLYNEEELLRLARKHGIPVNPVMVQEPALLHAPVGAWLLEHELGLQDREMLDAVRHHTTGAAEMSMLSRIVYLADFIEPGRRFKGVKEVRELAFSRKQLEKALLTAVEMTIHNVMQKGKLLHEASIDFRNSLILSLREKELEGSHGEG